MNPSPCQGHGGENFNCFIALTVADPERIFSTAVYSTLTVANPEMILATAVLMWFILTMTVAMPEKVFATAVSEYFSAQFAVV